MIDVSGHAVHSVTLGRGAPSLLIHCALARLEGLLPLAKAVGGQVTLMDMPGHGQSGSWDGKHDYQKLVAKAAGALCTKPTHLVGHSFGATAALRLAIENPEKVSRLTLIEPVYFAAVKGTEAYVEYLKLFRPFVAAMLAGDEVKAAEIFHGLWGSTPWDSIPAAQRDYLVERIHLIVATGGALEEDEDGITSSERLEKLEIPVTLIRGDRSQPIMARIHEALVDRIPFATDHVVAGAGHMLPMNRKHVPTVAEIIRAADPGTD